MTIAPSRTARGADSTQRREGAVPAPGHPADRVVDQFGAVERDGVARRFVGRPGHPQIAVLDPGQDLDVAGLRGSLQRDLAALDDGEVFVRSTDENFPTRRVTLGSGRARGLAWSPDNRVLFFASDDTGTYKLYYATVALSKADLATSDDRARFAALVAATVRASPSSTWARASRGVVSTSPPRRRER